MASSTSTEILDLRARPGGADVLVLRGELDRESLRLGVVALDSTAKRLAWLAAHLAELPGAGIIYTLTVAASQQVAEYLRGRGFAVAAYSGQTDPAERRMWQEYMRKQESERLQQEAVRSAEARRQDDRMPNKFYSVNRWPNIFVLNVLDPPGGIHRLILTEQDALKLHGRLEAELTAAGLIKGEGL